MDNKFLLMSIVVLLNPNFAYSTKKKRKEKRVALASRNDSFSAAVGQEGKEANHLQVAVGVAAAQPIQSDIDRGLDFEQQALANFLKNARKKSRLSGDYSTDDDELCVVAERQRNGDVSVLVPERVCIDGVPAPECACVDGALEREGECVDGELLSLSRLPVFGPEIAPASFVAAMLARGSLQEGAMVGSSSGPAIEVSSPESEPVLSSQKNELALQQEANLVAVSVVPALEPEQAVPGWVEYIVGMFAGAKGAVPVAQSASQDLSGLEPQEKR